MKLVMFDFDGVIVDSMEICFEISRKLYGADLDFERWRGWYTGNAFEIPEVQALYDQLDRLGDDPFSAMHDPAILALDPVPGVSELLRTLGRERVTSIVSSASAKGIELFLEKYALQDVFADVMGMEANTKKTWKMERLMEKHGVVPEHSVLITDTVGDVREAHAVGVHAIGVTWGCHDRSMFEPEKPYAIVDSVEELKRILYDARV